MANRQPGCLLQRLHNLAAAQAALTLSDRELLERFAHDKDQAAFAALVERHGGMVLAVCRRVLGHVQDAEDACQAALLVLARKATSIRKHDSLPGWLHRVAYNVATDLRRDIARRRGREEPASDVPSAKITEDVAWRDVRTALDEELQRLPERYRLPILLCYLEGKTRDEAAQELGWSLGTVKGRLERGRERLQSRLVRRGLSLSAALFGAGIGENLVSAAMPPMLAVSTAKAAVLLAHGKPASGLIATSVANLAEGAVRIMWMTQLKAAAALLLAIAVIGGTSGTLALRTVAEPSEGKKPAPQETALPQEKAAPRKDAKAMEPAWGDAVNGLEIAIARDWKGPVVFGERVRCRVLVRNVTAQEIGATFGMLESVLPAVKSEPGQQIGRGIVGGRKVGVLAGDKGHSLAINAEGIITGTIGPGAVATITRPAFVTRPYREFSRLNELTESTVFTDPGVCLLTETMVFALAQSPTEKFAVASGAVKLVIVAKREDAKNRLEDDAMVAKLLNDLKDPDAAVRRDAIGQLRILARCVDRVGGQRTQREPQFEPQVQGLVPVLIRAAGDQDEFNRVAALFALADTLDPAAVKVFRERLEDESAAVRFNAACFLTEHHDVSGLRELKKVLKRLRAQPASSHGFDAERLLASFERATGKSFGEIPMNPALMSDGVAAQAATRRYRELLDTWAAWWDWAPPAK